MDLYLFKEFVELHILQKISYFDVTTTLLPGHASLLSATKLIVASGF